MPRSVICDRKIVHLNNVYILYVENGDEKEKPPAEKSDLKNLKNLKNPKNPLVERLGGRWG